MKAEELMIGDWVCFDGDTSHECPVQIDGISKEEAGVGGDWYDIWEPIPLTEEILKKNADDVYERCENGYSLFGIGEFPNNIEVTIYPKGGVEWTINGNEYAIAELTYVHELQHALRLCGIKKEIVL